MDLLQFAPVVVGAAGLIMILAGLAAPFLAIYQAQKCYIDVYEDRVAGAYLQRQKGMVDQYISFEFTYDKIVGVSSHKNQVLLQTAAGTYTCIALNADDICQAIRARIR